MDRDDNCQTFGFFSRRATFMPKTDEELQAAAELVAKIEEENKGAEIKEAVSQNNKRRKKGKTKNQSQSEDDSYTEINADDSFSEVTLSAASKRRLDKLRKEQQLELERIEAENQKVLAAMDANSNYSFEKAEEIVEDFQKIAVLTFTYMSKISRLKCYENDKFLDIFPKVAELFNLKVTEFLLCLKARNITVDDTPKSLDLTKWDTIECIPYKPHEISKTDTETDGNTFKIIFQSNDSKKKIDMLVHKVEKMQDVMKRYSEQRNIPLDNLVFDFDGERLSGDETPVELDMESGNCIDVTVSVPSSEIRENRKKKRK